MTEVTEKMSKMTVHLVKEAGANEFSVERIELLSEGVRHRIKPTASNQVVRAVLSTEFATLVDGLIGKLSAPRMVFSDVHLEFRTKSAFLRGLQMIANETTDLCQKVTLRFRQVTGLVQDLFRNAFPSVRTEPRDLAVEALERVVARTYDAARVASVLPDKDAQKDVFREPIQKIMKKREELLFRLKLLRIAALPGWNELREDIHIPHDLEVRSLPTP